MLHRILLRQVFQIVFLLLLVSAASADLPSPLTKSRMQELLAELEPNPEPPWRTIPWKTSLLDGQQTASQQSKPIFIWAMDGHPLGCT